MKDSGMVRLRASIDLDTRDEGSRKESRRCPSQPTLTRAAPVIAVHEVDIEAPLDMVWRLHTDVNAWPRWQTDITGAHIDAAFEPGVSFDWTSYGFSVTSTVYNLAARSRVLGVERPAR